MRWNAFPNAEQAFDSSETFLEGLYLLDGIDGSGWGYAVQSELLDAQICAVEVAQNRL